MRVLHVLDFSLPKIQSGYSIRSKYIVDCQRASGLEPAVVTRDTMAVQNPVRPVLYEEELAGTRYFREPALAIGRETLSRLQETPNFEKAYGAGLSRRFRKLIGRAVRAHRPDLIHAASPDVIGLWSSDVAREYGIPLVYEVRGLWHETSVAMGRIDAGSAVYEKMSATFVEALKRADAIVTLSETVKTEIGRSGVPLERVHLVPNGVDTDRFAPRDKPADLMGALGLTSDDVIVGYVGSIRSFEGLDLTLHAIRKLRDDSLPVRGLIVGSGESLEALKALATELELEDDVLFPGQIAHGRAPDYVGLIDVYTMPRVRSRVTELVTPLKPYEALAAGKALIVSDVAALCEIVIDGETGLVCRADDAGDLAEKCARLVGDPGLRRDLGQSGHEWASTERRWETLVGRYRGIYEAAGAAPGRRSSRVGSDRALKTVLVQAVDDPVSGLEAVAGPLSHDVRFALTRVSPEFGIEEARYIVADATPDCLVLSSYPFEPWLSQEDASCLVDAAREKNPDVDVVCLLHDASCVPESREPEHYAAVCPVLYSLFDAILVTTGPDNPVDRFAWVSDIVVPVVQVEAAQVGNFLTGL